MSLFLGSFKGTIYGFEIENWIKKKNPKCFFKEKIGQKSIKKILKIGENQILSGNSQGLMKIFKINELNNSSFLINPEKVLNDFEFYLRSYIFAAFENNIYTWKKISSRNWKINTKLIAQDWIDKIVILKMSNLMITASFLKKKFNLWNIFDNKILFCGNSTLIEKASSIGSSEESNFFALGSDSGKIYIYSDQGILINILTHQRSSKIGFTTNGPLVIKFFNQNIFFSGGNSKTLDKWDIRVGKKINSWEGHVNEIQHIDCLNFIDYNKFPFLVSADKCGIVKIWDFRKEKEFFSFKKISEPISSLKII